MKQGKRGQRGQNVAWALGLAVSLFGCGGGAKASPEAHSPDAEEQSEASDSAESGASSSSAEAKKEELKGVPTDCAKTEDGVCLPSSRFVQRLCDDVHADVALVMFAPGTPWKRAYLTRKTEAWNASGGASVQGELAFDEEVLILRYRGAKEGGIQVSGSGSNYDALRWNGSCVSLSGAEVTFNEPPRKLHSRVEWKWLGEPMREALRSNPLVKETFISRRNECKGASLGAVTRKCEQLDNKLVDVIVEHVRGGGALAKPDFE
jgi:hypothetical protein